MTNKTILTHIYNIFRVIFNNKGYILKQFKYQILLLIGFLFYLKKYNNGKFVFGDV
jgi:hypothetical protein